ncbi:TPA: LPXTG cell wall anchor domain-containing protein [Streptococcus suis]
MKKTSKYVLLLSAGLLLAPVALNPIVDVPTVYATEAVASKELTISGGYYGMGVAIEPFTMTVKVGDTISIDDIKVKFNITATTQSFEMTDKEGAPTKRWNPGTTSIVVTEELLAYDALSITFASSLSSPQPDQGHFAYYLNLVDGSILRPNEVNPPEWNGAPQIPGYVHVALYGEGLMGTSVSICYYAPEGMTLSEVRRLILERKLENFVVQNLDSLFPTETVIIETSEPEPAVSASSENNATSSSTSQSEPTTSSSTSTSTSTSSSTELSTTSLFTAKDFPDYSDEQVLAAQVAYTISQIGGEALKPLFSSDVKTTYFSRDAGSPATELTPQVLLPRKTYYIESGLSGVMTYSSVITYSDNGDGTVTIYSIPDSLDRLGETPAEYEEALNRLFNEGRVITVLKPTEEEVLNRLQNMELRNHTIPIKTSKEDVQLAKEPEGIPDVDTGKEGTNKNDSGTKTSDLPKSDTKKQVSPKKKLPNTGELGSWFSIAGISLLSTVVYSYKRRN